MSKLIRNIARNGGVVVAALDSTDIVQKMYEIHHTEPVCSAALGRLLTAGALMGASLKSPENSITLRIRADGPAGTLLCVADGRGNVKGCIGNPLVELPLKPSGKLDVGGAVGRDGKLSVVKDLGMKDPYVSQVPLVSGEIAEDITSYFAVSEQIPTVCALGVLVDRDRSILKAGGYLMQLLPGAADSEIDALEANVGRMQSVTELLRQGCTAEDLARMALDGFEPEILDEQETRYHCGCSRERMERALISLGRSELEKLRDEKDDMELTCQFCDKAYTFRASDILKKLK